MHSLCCCGPCWTCSDCTCAHILIISVAVEWVPHICFSFLSMRGRLSERRCQLCALLVTSGVCFLPSAPSERRMCGQELFRPPVFVWKRNKDTSLHTPTPSVFNSHANEVGGNTNHESQSKACYGHGNANRSIRVHVRMGVWVWVCVCAGCHAHPRDREAKTERLRS